MKLPTARGPVSSSIIDTLGAPGALLPGTASMLAALRCQECRDIVVDDDLQLSLFILYELPYRGFDGVDDDWEWDPELLLVRRVIERAYESTLRRTVGVPAGVATERAAVAYALSVMTAPPSCAALARLVAERATVDQLRDVMVMRSVVELTDADAYTWTIPRLTGRPKAALLELQADEYSDASGAMRSDLFAMALGDLGLDPVHGAYVDRVPGVTLAAANAMSMFGLHRRLRGAAAGHVAATAVASCFLDRACTDAMRRLGLPSHPSASCERRARSGAARDDLAMSDLAGELVAAEPELLYDVLFGAAACAYLDRLVSDLVLLAWASDGSPLRVP
jgi:hypothetical protein